MPPHAPLTHFLALPLYTSRSAASLHAAISRLEEAVASISTEPDPDGTIRSIPLAALRPPGTLHLTLGVMSLGSQEQLRGAIDFLAGVNAPRFLAQNPQATSPAHGSPSALQVSLRGVHAMQAPRSTTVLYAEPHDASGRLRPLCEGLKAEFEDAGFVVKQDRDLRLHATLVNTVYAKPRKGGGKRGPILINATELIEDFKDEIWADVAIDKVVIYEMGATEGADGLVRYREVAAASLI